MTRVVDANGRAKTTVYDLAGRPTEQANEMGQKTRYGYDRLGNRVSLTDANGNVTRWTFDVFGRETSMTFPNGDKETYEYDRLGRMTVKTKPDGTVIRYEYDRLGRLVKIVAPDGEIIYEYDAWGRVVKEVSPTRTLVCEYDRLGRLIAVADSFTGKTVRYAYNRLGAREKLALDGIDVTYKYDRLLRLSEVQKTGEAAPAQYEHDAAGRRVALKLPNGVKTTYAHDAAGRLTKVESKNAAGNVVSAFGYALDATGNRTAMDVTLNGTVNHIAYEFDHAYRLTRETRKDAAGQTLYDEGLTYDPVGNRLTRNRTQIAAVNGALQTVAENTVYAYNAANQLLTETTNGVTTAYGYDKNGNNTTISTPAANGAPAKNIAMTYDWLNRQTQWTDGTNTENTVFAGADWKRASTTVSGAGIAAQTVKYLYDGDNVLADYDATNALTAFYVTPGLDQDLSVTDASDQIAYYSHDGLGSVRTLTSANGAILNRYDYTAFGETFAPNTSATTPNRYTYTAREQSPLAAHGAPMYYRWRSYAPQIGRFMWRDPIGYEGGVNVYGYVEGRVNLFIDPMGLEKETKTKWKHEPTIFKDGCGYFELIPIIGIPIGDHHFNNAEKKNAESKRSGYIVKFVFSSDCKGSSCDGSSKIRLVQFVKRDKVTVVDAYPLLQKRHDFWAKHRIGGGQPLPGYVESGGLALIEGREEMFIDSPEGNANFEVCALCKCDGNDTLLGCMRYIVESGSKVAPEKNSPYYEYNILSGSIGSRDGYRIFGTVPGKIWREGVATFAKFPGSSEPAPGGHIGDIYRSQGL